MTKKTFFYSAALLLSACFFGACGGDDDDDSDGSKNYTTSVTVEKSANVAQDFGTDDLSIGYWKSGEAIAVLDKNATTVKSLGTLSVQSTGSRDAKFKGTLRGLFTSSSSFTIYSPSSAVNGSNITYTYTDQDGTISKIYKFDYAKATATSKLVQDNANNLEINTATLASEQAICKFSFVDENGNKIKVNILGITSASGVAKEVVNGQASTGKLTITNGNSDKDDPIYVAIKNTKSTSDTFTFNVTTPDSKSYIGTATFACAPNTFVNKSVTLTEE